MGGNCQENGKPTGFYCWPLPSEAQAWPQINYDPEEDWQDECLEEVRIIEWLCAEDD